MKQVVAMVKEVATMPPGQPMFRNMLIVPRMPSRNSMKKNRNTAANRQRQKITAQASSMARKRAMAPPKLQKKAEPKTSTAPSFSFLPN